MTAQIVELGDLAIAEGAHLLVERALGAAERVIVRGTSPELAIDLPAWCRARGHALERVDRTAPPFGGAAGRVQAPAVEYDFAIARGPYDRWRGAERAGDASLGGVVEQPPTRWGLAARGALVEQGAPVLDFQLATKRDVWAEEAARLYEQAAAAQWDPATAIAWQAREPLDRDVERAVVQIMTYLIENETAALLVPVRFLGRLHPHFREVMQLLAIQAADEARHIEVFTRRARLDGDLLGSSTAGGQASLSTLFDEPELAVASFLLSVLGEGSFLELLRFLRDHAPDAITRDVTRLAAQDEARHVAFGLAHLSRHAGQDPALRDRLAAAIERRHAALASTAGLNAEVFDALVVLAAGSWDPAALRRGHAAVVKLVRAMDDARIGHLVRLGFSPAKAEALSALHTRNFM